MVESFGGLPFKYRCLLVGDIVVTGEFSLKTREKTAQAREENVKTREKNSQTREKTAQTREKIIAIIKESPSVTTAELAKNLGLSQKGVEWQLRQLKEANLIRRVGPDKGGHWEAME